MARESNGKFGSLVFVAIVLVCINGFTARGRKTLTDMEIDGELRRLNKPAIKTIKSMDGDIIDCVDINRQPAFDHPLLKNHTIQMRPSDYDYERMPASSKLSGQLWHKNGSCPEGTIPIQRIQKREFLRPSIEGLGINAVPPTESAKLDTEIFNIGSEAVINVWNIHVEPGEFSIAAIFVGIRYRPDFVAAGWMVSRSVFGDDATRLFGYYASDSGACFNLRCGGFVQTNKDIGFGLALSPVSTYGGEQRVIRIKIYRDPGSGNWWLVFNDAPVGYWPSSLFKSMVGYATYIQWGGQVADSYPGGEHTSTQMGSGHFPNEGFKKAAFFRDVVYFENNLVGQTPPINETKVDKPGCYGLPGPRKEKQGPGILFFYGGPGGRNCDQ